MHESFMTRNYLENMAELIADWLKEKEAEYQAHLLSAEVEKMLRQDEADAKAEETKKAKEKSPHRACGLFCNFQYILFYHVQCKLFYYTYCINYFIICIVHSIIAGSVILISCSVTVLSKFKCIVNWFISCIITILSYS